MGAVFDEHHVLGTGGTIHEEGLGLRKKQGPVVKAQLPGGGGVFVVLAHRQVREILAMDNDAVSTNPRIHCDLYKNQVIRPGHVAYNWAAIPNAFSSYGGEHKRLRRLISPAFSAPRINDREGMITRIRDELLSKLRDAFRAARGPVDLRSEFTSQVPFRVMCEIFGIPEEQWLDYEATVATLFSTEMPGEEVEAAGNHLAELVMDLIARKRRAPGDDMTSRLIHESLNDEELSRARAEADDDVAPALTSNELVQTIVMTIAAGWETTISVHDHAVPLLLTYRTILQDLRRGRITIGQIIEEVVRLEAPLAYRLIRAAVRDIEVDGDGESIRIPQGAGIVVGHAAAGRDSRVYADPDTFNPRRTEKAPGLAFGFGAHYCIGAALARKVAGLVLPALFEAFPSMELAVPLADLTRAPSFLHNDFSEVPVTAAA